MKYLALLSFAALTACRLRSAHAQTCSDNVHKHATCVASVHKKIAGVGSADDCCAKCASETPPCKQWTYTEKQGMCKLSMSNDPVKMGHKKATCGIHSPSPGPSPTPPTPPSPPSPPSPPMPPSPPAPGIKNTWAVIAAGSKGFMNYRHQADACHAYHVLTRSGIPAEQIILMMEDDVASSPENPFKGKLYNRNGSDVPDVYAGCQIDYKGKEVTADLFVKVITGDASAGGKVLKSTSSDRVFLNFVDHGGVGIVAFPNGNALHVTDLAAALKTMQQKKMFSELLFYMEACESGSMFPNLASDSKIFAVTAANKKESSWGWYCMPNDVVNGKKIGSCLGDLFSIAWMEDSDRGQFSSETIKQQVDKVTARTYKSHVSTFGDASFESEPFGGFVYKQIGAFDGSADSIDDGLSRHHNAIDVRDIPMETYRYRAMRADNDSEKEAAWKHYNETMTARKADDQAFDKITKGACSNALSLPLFEECVAKISGPVPDQFTDSALQCHKVLTSTVFYSCPQRTRHSPGGWNAYNMKFSRHLANMCSSLESLNKDVADLEGLIYAQCTTVDSVIVV